MGNTQSRCVVIGIGNPDRGDDGAGRAVARRLHGTLPPEIEVFEHNGELTSLLTLLEGAAVAILIDACVSSVQAGAVSRFDVSAVPLPQCAFNLSTHGLGLAESIELARSLNQLPPRCIVYAIEAESFEPGARLSPSVSASIIDASDRVRTEIFGTNAMEGQIDA